MVVTPSRFISMLFPSKLIGFMDTFLQKFDEEAMSTFLNLFLISKNR
jgi:hypothetical protein